MSSPLRLTPIRDNVSPMSPSETRDYIAGEARAALARDGRTAARLASDTGIPRSSLSKKLRGQVSFTTEEVVAICIALSIEPSVLLPPASERSAA